MLKRLLKIATAVVAFHFLKIRYLLAAILIALGVSQVSAQTDLVVKGHFDTKPNGSNSATQRIAPWTVNLSSTSAVGFVVLRHYQTVPG
jgi:hypothetical protein